MHINQSVCSVAVGEDLLQRLIVPNRQQGRQSLQFVLIAKPRDIAQGHLLGLLQFLILTDHVLVGEVEDVVGVDVQLNLVEFIDLDALEEDSLEDLLDVEGFVGSEDEVHFFFEEAVEEDVVAAVGARTDEVEVIDQEQEVFIGVFVEGLKVEDCPAFGFLVDVGLEVRLVFFLDFLALHDVHAVFVEPSLDAHSADFLQEGGLADSISSADVDVLLRLGAGEFLEDLVHLLPLPEHGMRVALKLKIDIVGLPEPWG